MIDGLADLVALPDPRSSMTATTNRGGTHWSGRIPIRHLVTDHRAMAETLSSGRVSETPGPIELCLREGAPGRFEIVDGHHRLSAALRDKQSEVDVLIYDYVDDEPYEGPFYDFTYPQGRR